MRRALLLLLSLFLAVAAPMRAGAVERVTTAIVFAIDVSGSVNAARYALQREGVAGVFADPDIADALGGGLAVAVMEWSDGQSVVVPWIILRRESEARALAERIRATPRVEGYSTAMSLALLRAADLLAACPCDPASRVIDVSGDGPNNGPMSTTLARDQVVARGIRINGLPIVTPAEPDLALWYRNNLVGGQGSFLEIAQGYRDFARAMRRKFLNEVAAAPLPPRPRADPAQAAARP